MSCVNWQDFSCPEWSKEFCNRERNYKIVKQFTWRKFSIICKISFLLSMYQFFPKPFLIITIHIYHWLVSNVISFDLKSWFSMVLTYFYLICWRTLIKKFKMDPTFYRKSSENFQKITFDGENLYCKVAGLQLRITQQICLLMKTSWRPLEDVFRLRLQKTSSRFLDQDKHKCLGHTSSRRFQDFFKTSCQDVFKTSSRRLQDVLQKTSSRHLQDVFKTFSRRLQDIFKTYSRRFEDVFKKSVRRLAKISSRLFQDVFKTLNCSC